MKAPSRRRERRDALIARLRPHYDRFVDIAVTNESRSKYLESTGSLVLDRVRKIAYACISERTDEAVCEEWASITGYTIVPFRATDREGRSIYHTNVIMAVGTKLAIVCLQAVGDATERQNLRQSLEKHHKVC
jgi:hypothetical protein